MAVFSNVCSLRNVELFENGKQTTRVLLINMHKPVRAITKESDGVRGVSSLTLKGYLCRTEPLFYDPSGSEPNSRF